MVSVRDPNNVGWDAGTALGTYNGYDNANRLIKRIDTQEQAEPKHRSTAYDANNNATGETDAKNNATSFAFDARDRKISMTDRLTGVTTWTYDPNGNVLTLTDPDNQAGDKPTAWTYDLRNQKLTEAYPDSFDHAERQQNVFLRRDRAAQRRDRAGRQHRRVHVRRGRPPVRAAVYVHRRHGRHRLVRLRQRLAHDLGQQRTVQ